MGGFGGGFGWGFWFKSLIFGRYLGFFGVWCSFGVGDLLVIFGIKWIKVARLR